MKIISWNVNGIRSLAQKGFFTFLDEQSPDILCLQETKAHPDQLEPPIASPLGWRTYWSAATRKGYSGTATFLREAPQVVSTGIGVPKFDSEGRFVITRHPHFLLYNVYFPNGGSGQERHLFKQEFLRKFSLHLKTQLTKGEQIILVGDYNVAYLDYDVYDSKKLSTESGFLPEERQWFSEFLKLGFIDTFRYFHPEERERYTWWSYQENARIVNRGWRIDYICISEGLKSRLQSADIMQSIQGSDHCPVCVELKL